MIILYTILILGGLGAVFALLLGVAAKKFAVETDPRIGEVREALPGANCGGCGFAGCDNYASAIVTEGASISKCPVGGAAVSKRIAEIMGVADEEREAYVALVHCQGGREDAVRRGSYEGPPDCRAAMAVGGTKMCAYGCMGLGNCVRACSFGAISINEKGVADVDSEKCVGCGMCVSQCPKHIISLVPKSKKVQVSCSALNFGKQVREYCRVGCIGCKLCEKTCPHGAIKVENNIPVVDYKKCTACGACVQRCPSHALVIDD